MTDNYNQVIAALTENYLTECAKLPEEVSKVLTDEKNMQTINVQSIIFNPQSKKMDIFKLLVNDDVKVLFHYESNSQFGRLDQFFFRSDKPIYYVLSIEDMTVSVYPGNISCTIVKYDTFEKAFDYNYGSHASPEMDRAFLKLLADK